MKKILAVTCSALLCGTTCFVAGSPAQAYRQNDVDEVIVQAFESCGNLDIMTAKSMTTTEEWAYTMMYDRLFEIGADGSLQPSLCSGWEFANAAYSASKSKTAKSLNALAPAFDIEDLYTDDLNMPEFVGEAQGYASQIPTDGIGVYLTGEGALAITLYFEDERYFNDGTRVSGYTMYDMITAIQWYSANDAEYADTLVGNLWSHVYDMYFGGEYITVYLTFPDDDYSFMDFMYDLASPVGSIFHFDGLDICCGSGAYTVDEYVANDHVTLERNDYWWGGSAPTRYITFELPYVPEDGEDVPAVDTYADILEGVIDIGFSDAANYKSYNDDYIGYDYVTQNPIMAFYSRNSSYMGDRDMRMLIDLLLKTGSQNEYEDNQLAAVVKNLSITSNDVWAFTPAHNESDMDLIIDTLIANMTFEGKLDGGMLTMIYNNDNPIMGEVAGILETQLNYWRNTYSNIPYIVFRYGADSTNFEYEAMYGGYDIVLTDIDLNDKNSIYKAFKHYLYDADDYSENKTVTDTALYNDLYWASIAGAPGSYIYSYYTVQAYCYNTYRYMTTVGWNNKIIMYGSDIGGVVMPTGLSPISDMSRLDFRWVYKV